VLHVALGGEAEAVRCLAEAATTGVPRATKTTADLGGTMTDIHTGPHMTAEDASAMIVMIGVHGVAAVAVHERHIPAAASHGTRRAVPHQPEKKDVETAPGLVLEADVIVIVIDHPLVVATVLALGVLITSIDMYLAGQQEPLPLRPPPALGSEKTVETASVMTAGLAGVTIAAIGYEATGLETMIAGMVEGKGAVDAKNPTATSLEVAGEMVMRKIETVIERAESGVESGVGREVERGAVTEVGMTETGAGA
jgi:hypothetical protein